MPHEDHLHESETSAGERLCFNDTFINTNADKKEKRHLDATAMTLTVPIKAALLVREEELELESFWMKRRKVLLAVCLSSIMDREKRRPLRGSRGQEEGWSSYQEEVGVHPQWSWGPFKAIVFI